MIIYIFLVSIGFYLLIRGSDVFVNGISQAAINLKIPKLVISLTIVAFGTSTPELFIAFRGILSGNNDIVMASVIGSTIANILLIIGVSTMIKPIKVKNETIKKQLPFHFLIISIFTILFLDEIFANSVNTISRSDASIIILIFTGFIYYIYSFNKNNNFYREFNKVTPQISLPKSLLYSLIGLIILYFGSKLTVDNCIYIANSLNINQKIITMITIVIGSATPELIMAITSIKKNEFDIMIGNIIGTNIFNIGFVLALPVLILGNISSTSFNLIDMLVLVTSAFSIYVFAKDDKKIDKAEGLTMLFIFILYYIYILFIQ